MGKKRIILGIALIGFLIPTNAQTNTEKAVDLKNQAIELMDNGNIEESLKLLQQAQELDPNNILIPYEIAFAYQLAKDYDKSIEVTKPLLKHKHVFDQVYQLIGNSYDLIGDKDKAIQYYDKGLKKFPNSGKLYLEKGIVLASKEMWNEALDSWEKGIAADPTHSSNYYYASQVLSQTNEKIWGIYYGEIFINLEPNTERTKIISKLIYDTYKACLPIKDNSWHQAFSEKATNISFGSIKNFKLSFETVHTLTMEKGCKDVDPKFTIDNLITIRKQFLTNWNEDRAKYYPNVIFEYHNLLTDNNMFDQYFYWLLKDGSISEFENWKTKNQTAYENFIVWYKENPMAFTDKNKTNRFSYNEK